MLIYCNIFIPYLIEHFMVIFFCSGALDFDIPVPWLTDGKDDMFVMPILKIFCYKDITVSNIITC